MIGKVQFTSSGYDPDHPPPRDPTLMLGMGELVDFIGIDLEPLDRANVVSVHIYRTDTVRCEIQIADQDKADIRVYIWLGGKWV